MYPDQRVFFDELPDELAGKLIKHLFAYVNDEDPEEDLIMKLAFSGIKKQLKHDLKQYRKIVERNKLNGQKGGRPKKPTGLSGFEKKPKKADKDKDKDKSIKKDTYVSKESEKNSKSLKDRKKQLSNLEAAKLVTTEEIEKWVQNTKYPKADPKWLFNKLQQFIAAGWIDGNGKRIKSSWKAKLIAQLPYAPEVAGKETPEERKARLMRSVQRTI